MTVGALGVTATYGVCQESIIVDLIVAAYWAIGIHDMNQKPHTVLRNFPVLGNVRFLFESVRPEIQQYFIESDTAGVPFSRLERSLVYQRSKGAIDTLPFGTRRNVNENGYEWAQHSMYPQTVDASHARVQIGNKDCKQPYSAALLNISGMSYGALSDTAIAALNEGAKLGGFSHNTGEGGVSRFHLQSGGDLVWNLGTGYFSARNQDGTFSLEKFTKMATLPNIKMIEIKLSQGAKPGHGGLLPGAKVTPLIAEARGVEPGVDCHSPASHSAFKDSKGLVKFIKTLRDASGGKPVGFKLCVGRVEEFCAIIHACIEADTYPDFITVDGGGHRRGASRVLKFSRYPTARGPYSRAKCPHRRRGAATRQDHLQRKSDERLFHCSSFGPGRRHDKCGSLHDVCPRMHSSREMQLESMPKWSCDSRPRALLGT